VHVNVLKNLVQTVQNSLNDMENASYDSLVKGAM
jgi:hypothetical protein